jgi:hypothetical protein
MKIRHVGKPSWTADIRVRMRCFDMRRTKLSVDGLLMDRLKIFVGSKEDGFKLALEDAKQFLVNRFTA